MEIEIDRIIRSKRKTVALIIGDDGSLTVRVPERLSHGEILEIVKKNDKWVQRKREDRRSVPNKKIADGELFLYLGSEYPLSIVEGQDTPLMFKDGRFLLDNKNVKDAKGLFIAWYRDEALRVISDRVKTKAFSFGIPVGRVRITKARKRWGSLSPTGNLNFTYRLVMAPTPIIDYVIAHELAHVDERNHSKRFWARVGEILPDYSGRRKWLRENGHRLVV